ncbi:MAG: Maf family protein [Phycisphaerales bacterium]
MRRSTGWFVWRGGLAQVDTMTGLPMQGTATSRDGHDERGATSPRRADSAARLFLASQSPRRRELLHAAGVVFTCTLPGFEDDHLRRGRVGPAEWVAALAALKARSAMATLRRSGEAGVLAVLGADTVVAKGPRLIGKAASAESAREIIEALRAGTHEVITGYALVSDSAGFTRTIDADRTTVRVGAITDRMIDEYIAGGGWTGKAGAYNLAERQSAGWPITCEGDPTTVMGLPMARVEPMLRRAGVGRTDAGMSAAQGAA